MKLETVEISTLQFDPKNARKHDKKNLDAIKGSLTRFGQQKPIVVDKNNRVIAGNGTLAGATALGWTSIAVHRTELEGDEAVAYALADNRSSELATWDMAVLTATLNALDIANFPIAEIGFDLGDFNLKDDKEPEEKVVDDKDDIVPTKIVERCKDGDVWHLGKHVLACGDSSNKVLISRVIGEHEASAIVTDPPYGLSFMGKKWDYQVPTKDLWNNLISRVKAGAHVLAFGGTRTFHRLVVEMEDAGLEIRDQIAWIYGQGFPKSLDIAKAIDKKAGAEREVVGSKLGQPGYSLADNGRTNEVYGDFHNPVKELQITAPSTPAAKQWDGWGTALKPALEPICVARIPLGEDTVAANVLKHGTGGLNIDGCRVEYIVEPSHAHFDGTATTYPSSTYGKVSKLTPPHISGRFPSNLVLDEEAAQALDEQSGTLKGDSPNRKPRQKFASTQYGFGNGTAEGLETKGHADSGGASRFFYVAKASKSDKGEDNTHATVKPVELMRYLVRLVTPENGTVLEPFAGSGTTLIACERENKRCVAIELDPAHCDIVLARWESLTGLKAELENAISAG